MCLGCRECGRIYGKPHAYWCSMSHAGPYPNRPYRYRQAVGEGHCREWADAPAPTVRAFVNGREYVISMHTQKSLREGLRSLKAVA